MLFYRQKLEIIGFANKQACVVRPTHLSFPVNLDMPYLSVYYNISPHFCHFPKYQLYVCLDVLHFHEDCGLED